MAVRFRLPTPCTFTSAIFLRAKMVSSSNFVNVKVRVRFMVRVRFRVRVRVKVSDFQNNIWRHLLNILYASHSRGIAIFSYPI